MQCPDCGAYYSEEDEFCGECGRRLSAESSGTGEAVPAWAEGPESTEELADDSPQPPPRPVAPVPVQRQKKKTNMLPIAIVGGVALLMLCLCIAGAAIWFVVQEESTTVPPTASIMIEPGVLLYEEGFGDPASGWSVFTEDDTAADYQDGGYQITIDQSNYMAWGNPEPPLDLSDMMIEVDVRQVEGPLDNNFGVLVRYLEDDGLDSYYWFQISGDGFYSADLYQEGEWSTLVGWEESAAIKTGLGVTNRIKLVCSGDQFSFYANNVHLMDVYDGTIGRGNIGLAAGAFGEAGVVVQFDNLRVYELGE